MDCYIRAENDTKCTRPETCQMNSRGGGLKVDKYGKNNQRWQKYQLLKILKSQKRLKLAHFRENRSVVIYACKLCCGWVCHFSFFLPPKCFLISKETKRSHSNWLEQNKWIFHWFRQVFITKKFYRNPFNMWILPGLS